MNVSWLKRIARSVAYSSLKATEFRYGTFPSKAAKRNEAGQRSSRARTYRSANHEHSQSHLRSRRKSTRRGRPFRSARTFPGKRRGARRAAATREPRIGVQPRVTDYNGETSAHLRNPVVSRNWGPSRRQRATVIWDEGCSRRTMAHGAEQRGTNEDRER